MSFFPECFGLMLVTPRLLLSGVGTLETEVTKPLSAGETKKKKINTSENNSEGSIFLGQANLGLTSLGNLTLKFVNQKKKIHSC